MKCGRARTVTGSRRLASFSVVGGAGMARGFHKRPGRVLAGRQPGRLQIRPTATTKPLDARPLARAVRQTRQRLADGQGTPNRLQRLPCDASPTRAANSALRAAAQSPPKAAVRCQWRHVRQSATPHGGPAIGQEGRPCFNAATAAMPWRIGIAQCPNCQRTKPRRAWIRPGPAPS